MKLLDSNILVYAYETAKPEKREKAKRIIARCYSGKERLAFSAQNLSEFFVNITQKVPQPLSAGQAKTIIASILEIDDIPVFGVKAEHVQIAINTHIETGAHYWDCLLAATMIQNGIFEIYTENTKDFSKIPGIKAINPLRQTR